MPHNPSHAGPPYVQPTDQPGTSERADVPVRAVLPNDEPLTGPHTSPLWRLRRAIARLRTPLAVVLSIVLLSTLSAFTVSASAPSDVLVLDTFERAVASGWGPSDNGRLWRYPAGRRGFRVADGGGIIRANGRGTFRWTKVAPDIRDVSLRFDFRPIKPPGGTGVEAIAVLRKNLSGAYVMRVRVAGEGRIWLSFAKKLGDRPLVDLGGEVLARGLRYRPGGAFSVRAEAVRRDPTQLRLKIWPAGGTEPAKWQLVRNDKNRDIGVKGSAGLGAKNTKGSTKRKAALRFDTVKIGRAPDTTRIGSAKRVVKADKQEPRIPRDQGREHHQDGSHGPLDARRARDGRRQVRHDDELRAQDQARRRPPQDACPGHQRPQARHDVLLQGRKHGQGRQPQGLVRSDLPYRGHGRISVRAEARTRTCTRVAGQPCTRAQLHRRERVLECERRAPDASSTACPMAARSCSPRMPPIVSAAGVSASTTSATSPSKATARRCARSVADEQWNSAFAVGVASPSSGITIHDFKVRGHNPSPGEHFVGCQHEHGVTVHGSSDILVYDVDVRNVYGDCFYVGEDNQWADGVTFRDSTCRGAGRMGVAIVRGRNVRIERVAFDDIAIHAFDIEPYYEGDGATNVVFRDNTVGTYNQCDCFGGSFFAANGDLDAPVRNIEVSNNLVTGGTLQTIVGDEFFGWSGGRQHRDIRFVNNRSTVSAAGPVLTFKHVDGLTITGNKQPLSSGSLARLVDTVNVTYEP